MSTKIQQRAYLTVYFEGEGGYNNPANQMRYSTVNFEHVFKFKKICKELGAVHSVRFKEENTKIDNTYLNRNNKVLNSFNKVRDFFNKPLWDNGKNK